jgi:hypothetical protein
MPPLPNPAPAVELCGHPLVHLLFASRPLLRCLRGERHEYMRRAWIACAHHLTSGFAPMAEGRTPTDPREACLQVFDASMQLARTHGLTGPDLVARFNHQAESGAMNSLTKSDDAVEFLVAALMVLVARKLQAVD